MVALSDLQLEVGSLLEAIQGNLLAQALRFRESHTYQPATYEELVEAVAKGFALAYWCGSADCEAQIKEETKATIRCIPLEQQPGSGNCIRCEREARERAIFGRAY